MCNALVDPHGIAYPLYLWHVRLGCSPRYCNASISITKPHGFILTSHSYSVELEYPADAIEKKVVNLAEGENFNPEFLKLVR